jgi:hypothetical protein
MERERKRKEEIRARRRKESDQLFRNEEPTQAREVTGNFKENEKGEKDGIHYCEPSQPPFVSSLSSMISSSHYPVPSHSSPDIFSCRGIEYVIANYIVIRVNFKFVSLKRSFVPFFLVRCYE